VSKIELKLCKIIDIETELGISYNTDSKESSLSLWYESIRDKYLSELTEKDVIRLIRQNLYLTYVLPIAFEFLMINPFEGEQLDGELITVISRIPNQFWNSNVTLKNEMLSLTLTTHSDVAKIEKYVWISDADKTDYVSNLEKIINNLS
jgi:hypothetical protein